MSLNATQQNAANRIYNEAVSAGIPSSLATLMVGQSGNETGGWASNFFVNNNNCFGYECDYGSKWQNGCSSENADNGVTVGNYDTIEDSTMEMVDYIRRRQADGSFPDDLSTITTADQYATLLKNAGPGAYYGVSKSNYAANIGRWLSNMGSSFITALQSNPGSVAPLLIVVAIGIYLGVKKGFFKKIFK
jgi:uncharacterized FlgJ-related protein